MLYRFLRRLVALFHARPSQPDVVAAIPVPDTYVQHVTEAQQDAAVIEACLPGEVDQRYVKSFNPLCMVKGSGCLENGLGLETVPRLWRGESVPGLKQ